MGKGTELKRVCNTLISAQKNQKMSFLVKLLETNSPKQNCPNQLDRRYHKIKEKAVLAAADAFLKANCTSLILQFAIIKR